MHCLHAANAKGGVLSFLDDDHHRYITIMPYLVQYGQFRIIRIKQGNEGIIGIGIGIGISVHL